MSQPQITLTGILVNARNWSMPEENNSGTTIHILLPQDDADKSSDFIGLNIKKLTGLPEFFKNIDPSFLQKRVDVLCTFKAIGQGFKAVPTAIALAK